jgi:hypothetical protein
MKSLVYIAIYSFIVSWCGANAQTLRLCPENPRYLEFKGQPVILITSAEHYGAVVNLDFDYKKYLNTLAEEGFNYTRIFSGTYIEPVENIFGIRKNTLAPLTGRFISPWIQENGKFDPSRFNPLFFERMKDFTREAAGHGIIVEITLFTSIYAENAWALSPLNPLNHIHPADTLEFHLVNTPGNGTLKDYQERFIRKVVREMNGFDNIFYEIQNEPWADQGDLAGEVNLEDDTVFTRSWQKKVEVANAKSMEWQAWVSSIIRDEESKLQRKHLIAQNICNFGIKLGKVPEGVSILNFHYAHPEAVIMNRDLGVVTGLDETGFMPHEDQLYINQAWRFVLSGGGLYNNLDYSFTAGNEDGTWPVPEENPGWGGPAFRKKLSLLVRTMEEVPFQEMEYTGNLFKGTEPFVRQYGLCKEGELYLVFVEGSRQVPLVPELPAGNYEVTWLNIQTGQRIQMRENLGNLAPIYAPFEENEVVLMIRK